MNTLHQQTTTCTKLSYLNEMHRCFRSLKKCIIIWMTQEKQITSTKMLVDRRF